MVPFNHIKIGSETMFLCSNNFQLSYVHDILILDENYCLDMSKNMYVCLCYWNGRQISAKDFDSMFNLNTDIKWKEKNIYKLYNRPIKWICSW